MRLNTDIVLEMISQSDHAGALDLLERMGQPLVWLQDEKNVDRPAHKETCMGAGAASVWATLMGQNKSTAALGWVQHCVRIMPSAAALATVRHITPHAVSLGCVDQWAAQWDQVLSSIDEHPDTFLRTHCLQSVAVDISDMVHTPAALAATWPMLARLATDDTQGYMLSTLLSEEHGAMVLLGLHERGLLTPMSRAHVVVMSTGEAPELSGDDEPRPSGITSENLLDLSQGLSLDDYAQAGRRFKHRWATIHASLAAAHSRSQKTSSDTNMLTNAASGLFEHEVNFLSVLVEWNATGAVPPEWVDLARWVVGSDRLSSSITHRTLTQEVETSSGAQRSGMLRKM